MYMYLSVCVCVCVNCTHGNGIRKMVSLKASRPLVISTENSDKGARGNDWWWGKKELEVETVSGQV